MSSTMAPLVLLGMICILAVCMAKCSLAQTVFNPMDFEAMADGESDDSQALLDAWTAACEHQGPSLFLIPEGTFLVKQASFQGPCFQHISPQVQIIGTLKATPGLKGLNEPAWIEFKVLDGLRIHGQGLLDGQGVGTWKEKQSKRPPMSLRLLKVNNATVTGLRLTNSKGFHLSIQHSTKVAINRLQITAPADSANTDGIHISNSDRVKMNKLDIGTGDDCISIGPGSKRISIRAVTCGPGHGISIGSLGKYPDEDDVAIVRVRNCTLTDTTNGIRIKTWPGSPPSQVMNVSFVNIIMNNVSNPIIIDQEYCADENCAGKPPSKVSIKNVLFRGIRGTTSDRTAVTLGCSKAVPCEDVSLQNINLNFIGQGEPEAAAICSNVKVLALGIQKPAPCL